MLKLPCSRLKTKIHSIKYTQKGKQLPLFKNIEQERRRKEILLTCRWWIMGTVILLNLANFAHWIAFPAVAKKAAAYYEVRIMIICIKPRRRLDVILIVHSVLVLEL